jgi:hypothetical protein
MLMMYTQDIERDVNKLRELTKQVKSYVYLGYTMREMIKRLIDIRKGIGVIKSTFIKMKSIQHLNPKQITNKLKKRIVKCYAYSLLLYGAVMDPKQTDGRQNQCL